MPPSPYDVSNQQPLSVTGKVRREVPLPSQEGKKGVMQYALYVHSSLQALCSHSVALDELAVVVDPFESTLLTAFSQNNP
jgi:hypothetical protein